MSMDPKWQRETSIAKIEREHAANPTVPVERLFQGAATYVGVTADQVRRWWAGRAR